MSVYIQGDQLRNISLGTTVRKTGTLVMNAGTNLFTVAGGLVAVTSLVGQVSTIIANTASLTMKLQHTPSGGAAGDLCGATGITNDAVGTFYGLTSGVATDLLSIQSVSETNDTTPHPAAEAPGVTYVPMMWRPIILGTGVIRMLTSNHDPGSGAVAWRLSYIPIDNGASVVAA